MRTARPQMSRRIRADGEIWSARLAERSPASDSRVILFFCVTKNQRPYRVVEVSAERVPDVESLATLRDDELRALYEASGPMDFPHTYPTYPK